MPPRAAAGSTPSWPAHFPTTAASSCAASSWPAASRSTAAAASRPIGSSRTSACRSSCPSIPRQTPRPENIPLEILYEDEYVVVVNKPPGMVVHPARGHWSGTLASALQFHFGPTLSAAGGLNRPGIVHRLDRDTSGAILVARNDLAHAKLAKQFAARSIEKEYFALVSGSPPCDRDIIDCPIGFHPHVREKMAIRHDGGETRPAQTFYEMLERFDGFAAVSCAAEDRPDASDPRPPEPHRLPGAVRSAIRRPQPRSPAAKSAAIRPTNGASRSPGVARPAAAIPASRHGRAAGSRGPAAGRHHGGARRVAEVPRGEIEDCPNFRVSENGTVPFEAREPLSPPARRFIGPESCHFAVRRFTAAFRAKACTSVKA